MKKILILLLFCGFWANAQQYHDKGAKFENATDVGGTITTSTRIPIIDEFGLINYYVDVSDLLALNPVPSTPNLQQVTNAGNTTNNKIIVTGTNGTIPQDGMYIASPGLGQGIVMNRNSSTQSSSSINFLPTTSQFQFNPSSQNATILTIREETPADAGVWTNTRMEVLPAVNANDAVTLNQLNNVTITESQITDLKDYLRGDVSDTNGANKLTLGSLEVVGQTTLQNGLNMTSVPTGTSDNILTLNTTTGDIEQRVFSLGDIDIANSAGVNQFSVGLNEQLRFEGTNDASVSFDSATKKIIVSATGGSSGEGGVDTFNGRDGAVTSQAGDYSTTMVSEGTNLYFTEPRVRATPLTGLTVTNTPISSTNTFLQALGRLQGQINDRITGSYTGFDSRYFRKDITDTKFGTANFEGEVNIRNVARFTEDGVVGVDIQSRTGVNGGVIGTYTAHDFIIKRAGATKMLFGSATTQSLNRFQTIPGVSGIPILGSLNNSSMIIGGTSDVFGLNFTTNGNGYNYIQSQRFDGATTTYHILLNALGGNVGVGVNGTPTERLQVNGNIGITGSGSGIANTGFLSIYEQNGFTRQGYIGFPTQSNSNLFIRSDVSNRALELRQDGMLAYNGSATFTGDVIANSDKRLKKNIKRIDNALAIVQLLGGYEYDRKDMDLHQAGVIAQEVEEVFPTAVSEDEKGIKSVAYNQLIALLIEAVKEQQIEIENLKTLINEK